MNPFEEAAASVRLDGDTIDVGPVTVGKVTPSARPGRADTVTIPIRDYLRLVEADLSLTALQAAGIDNWEGYGEVDWEQVRAGVEAAWNSAPKHPNPT